ncbi:MAG: 16S rRNA (cytidine(1402)-2'-O)-methyltransferase [Candidatus Wildermuthbacteria bacterium]|nr:16S rRNA (cytidine(1402)-2'-O)-methyltransferase [Candidatus Wildermuthbacteria bacterium]
MGTLFIVATPIGNLEDITHRALRVLRQADFILCEDTRVTKKLLDHYGIATPTLSYHQHSTPEKMSYVFGLLSTGKNIALVSDSGTPGIADPGNELIEFLLQKNPGINIAPIPGPSAVAAIASISGFPTNSFLFLGYPPSKKGRKKFFEKVAESQCPVIFYESPYRIIKTLQQLQELSPEVYAVVGRELTKQFETISRGPIDQVLQIMQKDKVKGEFVVIVYNQ